MGAGENTPPRKMKKPVTENVTTAGSPRNRG